MEKNRLAFGVDERPAKKPATLHDELVQLPPSFERFHDIIFIDETQVLALASITGAPAVWLDSKAMAIANPFCPA